LDCAKISLGSADSETLKDAYSAFDANIKSVASFSVQHLLAVSLSEMLVCHTLVSLNLSHCEIGPNLCLPVAALHGNTTLSSLDISNNSATGVLTTLATVLKTNRALKVLRVDGNQSTFEDIAALNKSLGGVNAQTGTVWGNKKVVDMSIPQKDVEKIVSAIANDLQMGLKLQQQGQIKIKSAYARWPRIDEPTKQSGIKIKVTGKKLARDAEANKSKLQNFCANIEANVERNRYIQSQFTTQNHVDNYMRKIQKQSLLTQTAFQRKKDACNKLVAHLQKQLLAWDEKMVARSKTSDTRYYLQRWRSEFKCFTAESWAQLKILMPADDIQLFSSGGANSYIAKTESNVNDLTAAKATLAELAAKRVKVESLLLGGAAPKLFQPEMFVQKMQKAPATVAILPPAVRPSQCCCALERPAYPCRLALRPARALAR
jgi:hypothetical protein